METLSIRLLGTLDIRMGGQPVEGFVSNKAQALLLYLAVTQRPVARTSLATLFWGDWGETAARRSLSKALSNLRQLVGDFLQIERHTVTFRAEQAHWLDVAAFEALLDGTGPTPAADAMTDLQQAVALYQGEFLEGFFVTGAPDFETWMRTERERLHQRCYDALTQLIHLTSHANEIRQAIGWTQQLLHLAPTDEEAHRRLMMLYMRNGQRSSALAQYESCRNILADELDVEPAAETVALYQTIRQGHDALYPKERVQQTALLPSTAFDRIREIAPPVTTAPATPHSTDEAPPGSAAPVSREPPFIGRRAIRQRVLSEWQQRVAGQPHVCLIRGEAGVGKTRLAEEVLQWVAKRGVAVARARAYAAAGELAYTPIIDWLRSPPLQQALTTLDPIRLTEIARLLPELTSLHPPQHTEIPWSPAPIDSQWQRQRLFEALARAFQADTTPKVLLLDDLQWCDRETLAWLHYFMQTAQPRESNSSSMAPLLIIATARPEILQEAHPFLPILVHLRSLGIMTEVDLEPLDDVATAALAEAIVPEPLTPAQSAKLYGYTEGNPLFIIETLRSTAWQGDGAASTAAQHPPQDRHPSGSTEGAAASSQPPLPARVQGVIEERLAALSPLAHRLAGLASVIGRSFHFALLQAASPDAEALVIEGLHELWQQGIVRAHGQQRYDFSHDRIREVAYLTVGPVQRPLWHRRVAEALETLYAADLTPVSAQLAFHWEEAGEAVRAVTYYRQAAEKAHALFADADAVALLQRALQLIQILPDTRHRQELELAVLLQMKEPLTISQGFVPKLGEICTRAKVLCEQVGTLQDLYQALVGLRTFYQMRANYSEARVLSEMLVDLDNQTNNVHAGNVERPSEDPTCDCDCPTHKALEAHSNDVAWPQVGYQLLGTTLLYQGELEAAWRAHEQAIARGSRAVGLFIFSSLNLWLLGYPGQARQYMLQAWLTARNSRNPYDMGFAMANLARLNHILRRETQTQLWATKTIALSSAYEIPFWPRLGRVLLGRVLAVRGKVEEGITLLQTTLQAMDEDQHFAFRTYFVALLAETYGCAERYSEALATLAIAMDFCHQNGEYFWHAELVRLQGEYRLALGAPPAEVIACYEEAIAIAHAQQARSLELRATMSLARLWQQQGREKAALARLAKIYNWFTEGFNTADLRAAKALLAELGDSRN